MSPLDQYADEIDGPSAEHRAQAAMRQTTLTKPLGSLGRLEGVAVELCALQRTDRPRADSVPFVVFAGDHGVTVHGTSPYPSEVTAQMIGNFVAGGAAISVLSRSLGLPLEIVDAGTLADPIDGIIVDKPCKGSADFTTAPAMTQDQLEHALGCGQRAVDRAGQADLLVLGEMGIGNTTAASAIASVLLGSRWPRLAFGQLSWPSRACGPHPRCLSHRCSSCWQCLLATRHRWGLRRRARRHDRAQRDRELIARDTPLMLSRSTGAGSRTPAAPRR